MAKKLFSIIFINIFIVMFCLQTSASSGGMLNEHESPPAPPEINIQSSAAFMMDAYSGAALYGKNESEHRYPASTTKIMTAYLTLKYGNPYDIVTLDSSIWNGIPETASSANLKPGEELTVYQLLQCLMIVSANEAANALGIYVSGSVEQFVSLMNEEAANLGCTNTHFINTNGLHDENHYTTAHDLALIAQAAIQFDVLRGICSTREAVIPSTNLSEERVLQTTNNLLTGTDYPVYDYEPAWGIKTGFTNAAGYCLVSAATYDDTTLICVVLGGERIDYEDDSYIGSFADSKELLSWGFENYDTAIPYQKYIDEEKKLDETNNADNSTESESSDDEIDSSIDEVHEAFVEESSSFELESSIEGSVVDEEDLVVDVESSFLPSPVPSLSVPEAVNPSVQNPVSEFGHIPQLLHSPATYLVIISACFILAIVLFIVLLIKLKRR